MKTIEQYLKDNHFTALETLKGGYCLDGRGGNLYTRLLNAMEEMMKDAYNEGVEDAAKNAKTKTIIFISGKIQTSTEHVDKESILKLKK